MFNRVSLVACLAAALALGSPAAAQHHGGGHGGGHAGGGHAGGYHGGGYHGGGYHGGGYHGGYGRGSGFYGTPFIGVGLGYGGYGRGFGYGGYGGYGYNTPYYGSGYSYAPSYYSGGTYVYPSSDTYVYPSTGTYAYPPTTVVNGSPAVLTVPPTDLGVEGVPAVPGEGVTAASGTIGWPASSTTRGYYSPSQAGNNSATVDVKVPADAQVWVGSQQMTQTGAERVFTTPPLTPGQTFSYQVKARWKENGKEVEQTRKVRVEAGKESFVDFQTPDR